jgi:SAM dependent carboxyl methyltransferase
MGDQPSVSGRMEGHGYYTKHSRAQRAFGQLGLDWIEAAAAAVEPPAAGLPFVIVDLGAAGGGSSLEPMRRALAARSSPGPALVVHTDIPSNDFSALFELVLNSPATYLGPPGVFALAAGRSFYDGLFPDNFVSLGWSSIAVHWLSRVSVPITGHIYCSFAKGAIRAAIRDQSAADWMAFLGHRARELRPTGRLVIMGGAARDDGTSGAEGLMDAANDSLRMMVSDRVLRQSEYRRMTIPTWNRTMAEFVAPFTEGRVAGRLEVRRSEMRSLDDPYFAGFSKDGDLGRYQDAVSGFFRAAFEESLWTALDQDRDIAVRDGLRTRFADELRRQIAADPARVACRWHVALLDIAAP